MRIIITFIFSLLSFLMTAQLQTNGGMGPAQLVQNVLLGSGVTVSNINYYGSNKAIGTFDANAANLGIAEGIIMTTGTIDAGPDGPHGPNNKPDAGMDNGAGGYSSLSNVVGGNTYNAAVLEFDFIPFSDSVRFKYIFASEEYPEYVGSEFNDVFAFFISGPGINGQKNMALIPGTAAEVTINNVNSTQNQNYYQANGDGSTAPFNSNPFYVQYDGFTKPMEAVSAVQCGETYHLIIAIADVGDAIYDSGIFLEKNSLTSDQPVKVEYELTSDPYGDGKTMAQNCSGAIVTITRSGPMVNQALTIPVTIGGTAIPGVDYSNVPTSIHFNPGETTITFTIDALNNLALSGVVNLVLQFEIEDPCGNEQYQTIELFIEPVEPLQVILNDQVKLCPNEPIELTPTVTGGGGNYFYQWSTGETTPTIFVNPSTTESYSVSVIDDCLQETVTVEVTVTVTDYVPLKLFPSPDIAVDCPYTSHTLSVTATGGAGIYTYLWFNESGKVLGTESLVQVVVPTTSTYTVIVTDYCGEKDTATVKVTILSDPLLLNISPLQRICPGDSAQITVSATGGWGDYHYYWPHSEETTASVWVKPNSSTEYTVIVEDDCHTFQVKAKSYVSVVYPTANFEAITNPMYANWPITFQNLTARGESYFWDFGNSHTSTMVHPNQVYNVPGTYDVTLIATDQYGCMDTIVKPIRILPEEYLYVPNTFTPDGDRLNHVFKVSSVGIRDFEIKIYNRWGEILFEAYDINFEWDGTYGGKIVPDGTYVWKIEYESSNEKNVQKKTGHINIIR